MKPYLAALGAGLVVGIIYSLMNVRSPAPPVIALVGLLGILLGEQIVPFAKRVWNGHPEAIAQTRADCADHLFGSLPARADLRDNLRDRGEA